MDWNDLLCPLQLKTICAHATAAYPNECCGMILRSGVRPCENEQNRRHALDPAAFPQRADRAFAFDARDAIFLAESQETDDPVLAIYHSHTNGNASFSRTDHAAILWNGEVSYPKLLHLVIECGPDGVRDTRLYCVRDGIVYAIEPSGQLGSARRT